MKKADKELHILLGVICDGIRQEVRYRNLIQLLAPRDDLRLTEERERGLVSALAFHIKNAGFMVHTEHYFYGEKRTNAFAPDLAIRLPYSRRYLFLELKPTNPGFASNVAEQDLEKLKQLEYADPRNRNNGFVAIGFAPAETDQDLFDSRYRALSRLITSSHRYREVGVEKVDLQQTGQTEFIYAKVGLWIRK